MVDFLSTVAVIVVFDDGGTNGDLYYTSEANDGLGYESVIKIIRLYMFFSSQLPQFLQTIVGPFLQMYRFN